MLCGCASRVQFINDDKNIPGVFADLCPDRWGRRIDEVQGMIDRFREEGAK